MKIILGTVIAALLLFLQISTKNPSPPGQETAHSAQQKTQTNKQVSKPSPAPSSIGIEESTTQTANQDSSAIKSGQNQYAVRIVSIPPRSISDYIAWGCTIALTVVGIVGVVIGIYTLRTIGRQTKATVVSASATQSAAEATQKSVDAIIDSERAWVMADIQFLSGPMSITVNVGDNQVERTGIDIQLVCKNDGRTPAWITGRLLKVRIENLIPDKPDFDDINILAGDIYDISLEPLGVGGEAKSPVYRMCCDGRVTRNSPVMIVYGYIKYRDVFSPDRETRFGYSLYGNIPPPRIQAYGTLWEYNSYT